VVKLLPKVLTIFLLCFAGESNASVFKTLKYPVAENPPVQFNFSYNQDFEDIMVIGTFEILVVGDILNHITGKADIRFISSELGINTNIQIDKDFALPPLQYKCLEWYSDESIDTCRINSPIKLNKPDPDLSKYEPIRIFDIDFDGEDEIVIGTFGGNRGFQKYQIYELEKIDNVYEAIPTISFQGNAEIDTEQKTITSRVSSDVCSSTVTTYQSDGTGFKVIKKVESDYFDKDNPNQCITRVLDLETTEEKTEWLDYERIKYKSKPRPMKNSRLKSFFRDSNINDSDKKVLDCMFSFDDNEYEKKLNEQAFLEAKREYCKYNGFSSYDNCDENLNQKVLGNPRFDNFGQPQECQIYLTIKKECEVEVAKESVFQGGFESTPSDYRKMNHRNSISHCIKTNAISYFNE